jgi:hypothetical protein
MGARSRGCSGHHVEQIVQGLRPHTETKRATQSLLAADFGKLRWCHWHNNASKLDKKLHQILLMCRIVVAETAGFKESLERIDYRVRDVFSYVLSNSVKPAAYGRRYRKGHSISSAMAESAVNQVSMPACASDSKCAGLYVERTFLPRCDARC